MHIYPSIYISKYISKYLAHMVAGDMVTGACGGGDKRHILDTDYQIPEHPALMGQPEKGPKAAKVGPVPVTEETLRSVLDEMLTPIRGALETLQQQQQQLLSSTLQQQQQQVATLTGIVGEHSSAITTISSKLKVVQQQQTAAAGRAAIVDRRMQQMHERGLVLAMEPSCPEALARQRSVCIHGVPVPAPDAVTAAMQGLGPADMARRLAGPGSSSSAPAGGSSGAMTWLQRQRTRDMMIKIHSRRFATGSTSRPTLSSGEQARQQLRAPQAVQQCRTGGMTCVLLANGGPRQKCGRCGLWRRVTR